MGKRCCGCCSGSSCCGCCCGRRGATVAITAVGILLAAAAIAPPAYIYQTDGNYNRLFPPLRYARAFLAQVTEEREDELGLSTYRMQEEITVMEDHRDGSTIVEVDEEQTPREKYKLAIFQLLDDIQSHSRTLALASFSFGCLNIPIHMMLLIGTLTKTPCMMLPWLAVTLLEHLVIGVPLIVFTGIISLYLCAQLQLHLVAGALMGSVVLLFLISLSSWFTVHSCYGMFYRRQDYYYDGAGVVGTSTTESSQPLLTPSGGGRRGPAPPPGHPNGAAYQSGGSGYPQYYPPHHQSRQLPSAPPQAGSMYPSLA